jgi:glycosyltransferase involved in cell wall biosynthesis
MPILFRGDSHLLDAPQRGWRWRIKRAVLERVFSWPDAFLAVGTANRAYYEAFGVEAARLHDCPHSIDVHRFAEPADQLETEAAQWRRDLGISGGSRVLLFAGKFEDKKRPVELMQAVQKYGNADMVLVMVGAGQREREVNAIAAADPNRFRLLPFQNQSRMPVVYRLGDVLVLPSAFGETWGLAANEATACGRPVLLSDRVGCAADVVDDSCGRVFHFDDFPAMMRAASEMTSDLGRYSEMRVSASRRAWKFDLARTEAALMECLAQMRLR